MGIRALGRLGIVAAAVWLGAGFVTSAKAQTANANAIEQWDMYELTFPGPATGNPMIDVQLSATFSGAGREFHVDGFYDGDGIYRIRFMPQEMGEWRVKTSSNRPELDGKTSLFNCVRAGANNHGPVHVARTFHFDYADGSPYLEIGTTCYGWHEEPEPLEQQTLATLKASPFNKVRMTVLPGYPTKLEVYPYLTVGNAPTTRSAGAPQAPAAVAGAVAGEAGEGATPATTRAAAVVQPPWDYSRLNPAFFQHLDKCVGELRDLNIQADVILYTPYGRGTGFNGVDATGKGVDAAGDERYLKYVVARLGAYRNVWWSMANEYDFMAKYYPLKKDDAYWDKLCQIVANDDPYHHLLSIHFSGHIYNNNKPWITHVSVQNGPAVADFGRAAIYRQIYYKPVVFDEVKYEGDIDRRWGQLTGEEMTAAFWHGWIDGTYVGHGETFKGGIAWTNSGGTLRGQSPARIAFLKKVMEESPEGGVNPMGERMTGRSGEYYLIYFGDAAPKEWSFVLPNNGGIRPGLVFKAEILDTWNMTVTPVPGTFTMIAGPTRYNLLAQNNAKITLPGKPYQALRITLAQ